ncbi:DUF5018 domain-containing protein [Labilibaculum euxinus]|uniref:DUF5018 domain-containing protein n=1 Tax=Labilibaculum euxinus TaxID=2686357 RepID=A0A7M4D3E2_9BACT|nr:DUF5018 domain-containing protein [Labilibaculum euxinus]MUP37171.1 DUF5018 domain-containing protein [Labilibaculum euxinus]MVB06376.1 DUF5018 domain-containing protein [Labilibaculum euxinus]
MIKFYKSLAFILAMFLFTNCDKDEDIVQKSKLKQITEFSITTSAGNLKAVINEFKISITVPKDVNLSSLTPTIKISAKSQIFPLADKVQDFTKPVTYTVTAEDGSKQDYTVSVEIEKSKNCTISEFLFKQFDPIVTGLISNFTIELTVPIGTDLKKLIPNIVISDDASISPKTDVETDFSSPVTYTVTAEDKTEQKYVVTVNFAKSSENKILEFKFEEFTPTLIGVIDHENNTIKVTVPWAEKFDIYSMKPSIVVSELATVNPESGKENNFKVSQTYTVTAEDNSTKIYTATVSIEEAPEPTLEALTKTTYSAGEQITIKGTNFSDCEVSLNYSSGSYIMTIDEQTTSEVSFTLPSSTKLGEAELTMYIRDVKYSLGDITILPPAPIITGLSTSNTDDNVIVTIAGDNFSKGNNMVYFVLNNQEHEAYIKKDGDNSIQVILNPLLTPGSYNVKVKVNDKEVTSNKTIEITAPTTTNPIITAVNKAHLKRGEKLIVDGANLTGNPIQISIIGNNGSIVRNVKVLSDTQVEYVIPEDLNSGIYEISLQMYIDYDLKFSNVLYNISIED